MKVEKIRVTRTSLASLMHDMKMGRIRIPRFQRIFVWERKRIQELLDSMYKEYPIGTIFLWNAPAEYNHLLRTVEYFEEQSVENNKGYSLILDGQQRLTSLYAVVNGLTIEDEDYRKIVVDLNPRDPEKLFIYREPDNKRWVSIQDLLQGNFQIYNSLPTDEHRAKFVHCRDLISNYPFSLVTVEDMGLDEAVEIFERINRSGKPLNRFDLITASVLDSDFDLRERTDIDIITPLEQSGFGTIESASIPQSLALNIRNNTESATQMDLKKGEVKLVWSETVNCFMAAVDYVKHNLGVERLDFLPYDAMLPMISYYFFYTKRRTVDGKHREQLERWFWRVAFSERYSGASQTRMSEDAVWIRSLLEKGTEYENQFSLSIETLLQSSMRYTTSAVRNGVVCILNLQQPLHFQSGARISLTGDEFTKFNVAEKHHIFPVGFLRKLGLKTSDVHLLPNFCFIPSELNRWIGDKPPSQYMEYIRQEYGDEHFMKVMRSHLIPVGDDSGIWTDNYSRFLRQRSELLLREIRKRCGIPDRIAEEDRDPLVNQIENAIRDTIHIQLSNNFGLDYWAKYAGRYLDESKLNQRIDDYIRKTAGANSHQFKDARAKLDFCFIYDYLKIINENWSVFSSTFISKKDFERAIEDFNDFRNAVKHNRETDTLQEHRAKAAIIWLSRTLDLDLSRYDVYTM